MTDCSHRDALAEATRGRDAKLKKLVADLLLDGMLQDVIRRKLRSVSSSMGTQRVASIHPSASEIFEFNSRPTATSLSAPPTCPRTTDQGDVPIRGRCGYRRIHVLLRRKG
jgi:hypothetical protein